MPWARRCCAIPTYNSEPNDAGRWLIPSLLALLQDINVDHLRMASSLLCLVTCSVCKKNDPIVQTFKKELHLYIGKEIVIEANVMRLLLKPPKELFKN